MNNNNCNFFSGDYVAFRPVDYLIASNSLNRRKNVYIVRKTCIFQQGNPQIGSTFYMA